MTGSFLFVKPSNPDGEPGTAYSDGEPQYAYDRASWEWLLERALRRTLIPWSLTKSNSRALLRGHEDQYSMHRWRSYGVSNPAGRTPLAYTGVGGPGSYQRKTDADLSGDYRTATLPVSWNSYQEAPVLSSTIVTYGIDDLEKAVADLPFSLEWLHPDWSPDSARAWDLTASTTETTIGEAKPSPYSYYWTWKTTVEHVPFEIPNKIPFKCLSHMRTDGDIVTVDITNDGNKSIKVETAPTPFSAPRTLGGSILEFHGTKVRVAAYGAAYKAGWALSEFSVLYRYGLDYSESTGPNDYYRGDKTSESYSSSDATLGCLVDIPGENSGYITVSSVGSNGREARFIPDVDWVGNPTWWHANGFPKGLSSVISPKLKKQLWALCPVCQPAIPPAVPALQRRFPDVERLQWVYDSSMDLMYPRSWLRHLELACTPIDISARLDAMTTTVHRVPSLFAKVKTVTTNSRTIENNSTDSFGGPSWTKYSRRNEVTVEGTSTSPIPAGSGLMSVSSQISGVETIKSSYSRPGSSSASVSETRYTWEESLESNSEFLVCLRTIKNTTLSTKTTTKTVIIEESGYSDGPHISEDETSKGDLPDSYDPDPDDLLFPEWVLPWIEDAELFASIDSRIGRSSGADMTITELHHTEGDESTNSYSGSGSGSRTHKAHWMIVSLGKMDNSTGRFSGIDAAKIISEVDPDPTDYTSDPVHRSITKTTTDMYSSDGIHTREIVETRNGHVVNSRSRYVSYYVVVKWKFDRLDPETFNEEGEEGVHQKAVDETT